MVAKCCKHHDLYCILGQSEQCVNPMAQAAGNHPSNAKSLAGIDHGFTSEHL